VELMTDMAFLREALVKGSFANNAFGKIPNLVAINTTSRGVAGLVVRHGFSSADADFREVNIFFRTFSFSHFLPPCEVSEIFLV